MSRQLVGFGSSMTSVACLVSALLLSGLPT
jgi:hypothetical protein